MGRLRISRDGIPMVDQQVFVGGVYYPAIWCSAVSHQHGLGGTTARFDLPFVRGDQIGDMFQDLKVIVYAGLEGTGIRREIFAGFLSLKNEDISETTDGVTLTAYTAAHYLDSVGVGEESGYWRFKYPLVDEDTGIATGWTPLRVLIDLFSRLSADRLSHLRLGNTAVLGGAYDIPTQIYDFSITNYRDAIESIVESMGNVAVRELFYNGVCYLDFFRVGDPSMPVSVVNVASLATEENPAANVFRISPSVSSDNTRNRAIAFGRDKEFVITCKSVVETGGAAAFSEPNPLAPTVPFPLTALVDDWDSDLEDMVIKDPKLASSNEGKVSRTATTKPQEYSNGKVNGQDDGAEAPATPEGYPIGPGPTGTTFWIDVGIHLVPLKTILIHPASGERMLVTAYRAYEDAEPADPEHDPPIPLIHKRYAEVTVTRLYQPYEGQTAGFINWNEPLSIEIPGIDKVFKDYLLPLCLRQYYPEIEIQTDIPLLDPATNERRKCQAFQYITTLVPSTTETNKKDGEWSQKPRIVDGFNVDKEKWRVRFSNPTVQVVEQTKKTVGSKSIIESKYERTVVGVTFSYIDPHYTFGWDTGAFPGQTRLPWISQCEREQYDELVYQQTTNQVYPVKYTPPEMLVEQDVVFGYTHIDPDTAVVDQTAYVVRSDLGYLRTYAYKSLGERYRRHVSYDIEVPWLAVGYTLGNRLAVTGLSRQPRELLTITGVVFNMEAEGEHNTLITVDNTRPPYRRNWNFKAPAQDTTDQAASEPAAEEELV